MDNNPKIFVVTAVHNYKKLTEKLVKSIFSSKYINIEVVIVDDGSDDGTEMFIKSRFPSVTFLKGDGNLWWTGAMHAAVEYVLEHADKNDYILTINNDCFVNGNYLTNILKTGLCNKRSIVGSVVKEVDTKEVFDAGVIIDWKKGKITAKILEGKDIGCDKAIDTLSTKGTLFPVEVFREVGNFNKGKLPHYLSDYEMVYRAKLNGWKPVVDYSSVVFNEKTRTGKEKNDEKAISFKDLKRLLFDRKSKNNIVDKINFIGLCCPKKYILQNYFLVLISIFYYLSFTYPFYFSRPIINKIKNIYL